MLCVPIEAILMSTHYIPFVSLPGPMINPQWPELPMSRTDFYGPKDVRAIKK